VRSQLEQALQLVRDDRPESLDRALTLLQNTVYSFSMKVCGHAEDAEDTAQDVLLKSLPYLAKFENPKALTVWLYKVARNHCVSNHRGLKNSASSHLSLDELMPSSHELKELMEHPSLSPEAALLNSESAEQLKQAVMAIPPTYRMVLVLHDMEELSTAEVAQVMGLREGTVRVRLHRARLLVRQHLAKLTKHELPGRHVIHAAAEPARPPRCRHLFAQLSAYMDAVIDDAMCDEMDRHISDCEPCQAFLSSLKDAVRRCRAYRPAMDSERAERMRRELRPKYEGAVAALRKHGAAKLPVARD
jgi:RNA polymerase sigma-70 factor (ECF subfamily)